MTVIAYRDGVIAADTGAQVGGTFFGHARKIARDDQGRLAGAAGNATYAHAFLKWFKDGDWDKKDAPPPPEAKLTETSIDRGVIFLNDGSIRIYEPDGMFEIRGDFYALGSGRDIALGAMHAGADAVKAAKIAAAIEAGCCGDIEVLTRDLTVDIAVNLAEDVTEYHIAGTDLAFATRNGQVVRPLGPRG